jgi:branched-chain amino acid transport system substrate-binding protein
MKFLMLLLVPWLAFAPADEPPVPDEPKGNIKIGVILSTTGPLADFGIDTKYGIELAVSEVNQKGGINGRKVEIVFHDAASKSEEAGRAATKLVADPDILAGLGCVASGLTLNAAPRFQRAGVPLLTPSSTNPTVTEIGDKIFRACYLDEFQAQALAWYAWNDLKLKRAALLTNRDDAYSTGLAAFFKATFTELGGEVATEQTFPSGTTDFNTQLKAIKDVEPDLLFMPIYYTDASLIARQAAAIELKCQLMGGDGWEGNKLIPTAGDALDGAVFGTHFHAGYSDAAAAFFKAYKEAHKREPSSLAGLGYDAARMIFAAIEKNGATRKGIADGLRDLKDFDGTTGKGVSIDDNRNAAKPLVVVKVVGEDLTFVREVTPKEVADSRE